MRASWVLLLICLCPPTLADGIVSVECSNAGFVVVVFESLNIDATTDGYVRDCDRSATFSALSSDTYRVVIDGGTVANTPGNTCGEDTPGATVLEKTFHIVVPQMADLISGGDLTFKVVCEYKNEFITDLFVDHSVSTLTPMFTTEITVPDPLLDISLDCYDDLATGAANAVIGSGNTNVNVGDSCLITVGMTDDQNGFWTKMVMTYVQADIKAAVAVGSGETGIEFYNYENSGNCVPAGYSSLDILTPQTNGESLIQMGGSNHNTNKWNTNSVVQFNFDAFLFKDSVNGAVYFKVGVKVCSDLGVCSITCTEPTASRRKRSADDLARVERSAEEEDELLPTESNSELDVMLIIGETPENTRTEEATIEPVMITDDVCLSKDVATTILVCLLLLLVGAAFGGPLVTSLRMRRNLAASVGKSLPFSGLSSPAVAVWSSKSACDPHNVLVHHDQLSASSIKK